MRKVRWIIGLLVVAPLPLLAAPVCVTGASGTAPSATISWAAPTKNTDGTAVKTPLTYNLYQGIAAGAETKAQTGISALTLAVSTGLLSGSTYYWYVTTVDSVGTEGIASNEVCKTFPASVPSAVTITIS